MELEAHLDRIKILLEDGIDISDRAHQVSKRIERTWGFYALHPETFRSMGRMGKWIGRTAFEGVRLIPHAREIYSIHKENQEGKSGTE